MSESVPATLPDRPASSRAEGRRPVPVVGGRAGQAPADFDVALTLALWHHTRTRVGASGSDGISPAACGPPILGRPRACPDHPAVLSNLGLLLNINTGELLAAMAALKSRCCTRTTTSSRYNRGNLLGRCRPDGRGPSGVPPGGAAQPELRPGPRRHRARCWDSRSVVNERSPFPAAVEGGDRGLPAVAQDRPEPAGRADRFWPRAGALARQRPSRTSSRRSSCSRGTPSRTTGWV